MAPPTIPIHERVTAKYRVEDRGYETPCWVWTAGLMGTSGYAQFRYSKAKNGLGHRYSYEHHIGPIPEGMTLDHLCRVRECVNPEHLEVVTPKVNILRGKGKGAANKLKTHCVHGHEFTPENTYINAKKARVCRACQKAYRDAHRDEMRVYHRDYMRTYSRERYATDAEYREARKQANRNYAPVRRERYATDEEYRARRKEQIREYRARLLADAKKWREAQSS